MHVFAKAHEGNCPFVHRYAQCVCDQHHDQMTSLESPTAGVQRASRVSYPQYFPPPLNSCVDHAVLICELCNCVRQCVLFLFQNIWNADV